IDQQVKIRGFRIELGEIESVIRKQDMVQDCAVIVSGTDNDKAICAYIVAEQKIDTAKIRTLLHRDLPEYMIPSYFMQIDSIPVTKNGKLNRKALPKIKVKAEKAYVAPRNIAEATICQIFGEILEVEQVGIQDSFFELGGHSLKATRLVNRIEEEMGTRMMLKEVFSHPTPEQLAVLVTGVEAETYEPIPKAEEKSYYPMSSAQKRTYLIQQMDPESVMYNMPQYRKLTGKVKPEAMRNAMQEMIQRHEILRTEFGMVEGEPIQKILGYVDADFVYRESTESDEVLMQGFVKPFDLHHAPPVRVELVNKGSYHLLMIDMHHIVSDGMSLNTFNNELTALYNGKSLPPLPRQFKDYSEWMRSRDLSKQEAYWKEVFAEEAPVLDMPLDYRRPQDQSNEGENVGMLLDAALYAEIKQLAQTSGATDYMIFLAAAMILFSKYSGQEDIVIGSPVSGRTHKDTEYMLGMFVNTLAMRGRPEREKTVKAFLGEIKESCLKAYENQEYPFEELVETVQVHRDLSRNPLFDVMVSMQNNDMDETEWRDLQTEETGVKNTIAKFDLTFDIVEIQGQFGILLEYCTALYKRETAERMMQHYAEILKQITAYPERKLKELELVTAAERKTILKEFNATAVEYARNQTMIQLLEEQAERTPKKTAVVFEGTRLTYAELHEKANQLGHRLREMGVNRNDFVGIVAERSAEMIVGILGILKAGGAYIPIDPTNPEERIQYILQDSGAKIAVTYGVELKTELPVIDLGKAEVWNGSTERMASVNQPEDLLYCIYTSGTTGQPKGVMIGHRNAVNLMESYREIFQFTEEDRVLQFASYCFDQSVGDIFSTLTSGAELHIASAEIRYDMEQLESYMAKAHITAASLTPKVIHELHAERLPELRLIDSGGEAGDLNELKRWIAAGKQVINSYGPTESTVNTTYEQVTAEMERLTIGKPASNIQVYILEGRQLCGIGIPGELCIAGDGLAKGYLNQPELTREKFVENPFGEGKLYRSGDLARWQADGRIVYLGRIDEQVKIRGFRIELGEIESRLREIEGIKDCAVIARKDRSGEKAIYAYYVCETELEGSYIRNMLSETMPEYMLPSYLMQVAEIPMTKNGKLDKRGLPEIIEKAEKVYTAPKNQTEETICRIFEEILQVERVGAKDSFFELGGHSLRATRLVNRIEAETGVRIVLKEIFTHSTPEQLAQLIAETEAEEYEPIPKAEEKEYYPMSSAQKRIYLIQQMDPDAVMYNMPHAVKLTGNVNSETIRQAMQEMINRHEILRTEFHMIEGEPVQKIVDHVEADFVYLPESEKTDEALMQEFLKPFDLSRASQMRMQLVNRGEYHLLMMDTHHIISDGASDTVFMKEFNALCSGETLEPLNHQFKDYSEWMRKRDLSTQKEHWLAVFEEEVPILDMPLDYPRPQEQQYSGAAIGILMESELLSEIRKLEQKTGATAYMIFLAAAMVMLSKYSRQEDVVIGSPVSSRTHKDTEDMLGMFVNTLAMRGRPQREKRFADFLMEMKE
ncbi:MAG: amino acid adenylation domain-containing protein, partial [Ruminococcus sp.]